jgi:hypothetical protein
MLFEEGRIICIHGLWYYCFRSTRSLTEELAQVAGASALVMVPISTLASQILLFCGRSILCTILDLLHTRMLHGRSTKSQIMEWSLLKLRAYLRGTLLNDGKCTVQQESCKRQYR